MSEDNDTKSADTPTPCEFGDSTCPCQDGDECHYKGEHPMTPPDALTKDNNDEHGEGYCDDKACCDKFHDE